jgi:hypothetical protein
MEGKQRMGNDLQNRRQFLIGAGLGAVGAAAVVGGAPSAVFAAGETGDEDIEGGWYISIHVTTPGAPMPTDFDALYSFAKGGVFARIDGRTNAPGLGTWMHSSEGIVFSAILFNFTPGVVPTFATRKGAIIGNFVARVVEGVLTGTFTADGILGLSGFHRDGTFTGTRIAPVGP